MIKASFIFISHLQRKEILKLHKIVKKTVPEEKICVFANIGGQNIYKPLKKTMPI